MELTGVSKHVLLCNGVSCSKNGSEEVTNLIRQEIKRLGLMEKIHTTKTLCNGRCKEGPIVIVYPDGDWYKEITPKKSSQLINKINNNEKLIDSLSYKFEGKSFKTI
ncbi:(2Fe-2S) ferredoxin domain-containing protein [Bacillus sp. NEB1478]|uniref:(2Fe-2S) ferredoxin domain-containing protein n=1 Tax=Bacillus sp. NEB1478 TaxID=3073816 RepID=UPI002872B262|nr:(2Fe-2S) ferredoxin domain-containing protein [Bacillus sp. NEB1478]WNB92935.1 (2Fe-2S) ferredoxin domain-containing protein [Bacillus sp. NEB1478]